MSRSSARARPGQDRASLYAEITDKIIAELEAGRLPWVQPWGASGAGAAVGLPKNAATGRRYSGINVLILWGAVIERGTTVVYADRFIPEAERERADRDGDEPHQTRSARSRYPSARAPRASSSGVSTGISGVVPLGMEIWYLAESLAVSFACITDPRSIGTV